MLDFKLRKYNAIICNHSVDKCKLKVAGYFSFLFIIKLIQLFHTKTHIFSLVHIFEIIPIEMCIKLCILQILRCSSAYLCLKHPDIYKHSNYLCSCPGTNNGNCVIYINCIQFWSVQRKKNLQFFSIYH